MKARAILTNIEGWNAAINVRKDQGNRSFHELGVAATAEGYPFPVNLDVDSPLSGMTPPSQQDLMRQALSEGWTEEVFVNVLEAQAARKRSH